MNQPQRERAAAGPGVRVVFGPRREWSTAGATRATGHAFRGDVLLPAAQLAKTFESTESHALLSLLGDLSGSFAVVKETPDAVYAVADQIRGIPLYCVDEPGGRVVTDDPLHVTPEARANGCDWPKQAELLKSACVSVGDTLLDGVRQVEAGTVLRVPCEAASPATVDRWYAFQPGLSVMTSRNLVETAYESHRLAVERTIRFADSALIAVPLSGGLDSGILAALLARSTSIDRDQVLTYTFGRLGNKEAEASRRVAETLGLRWEFVPYTERTWQELAAQPWWPDYLAWASALAGVPAFDDLPAVTELRRRGLVPDDSVVVPGHSLGFPAGSYIPGSMLRRRRASRAHLVRAVLATYYKYRTPRTIAALLGRSTREIADAIWERADRSVPATPDTLERAELLSAVDEWGWKERQAKLIVNGVRTYEHLGLRWSLPWWDRSVVDFWVRAPLRARVGQRLRSELAEHVGWPTAARSTLGTLQERLDRQARVVALDGPAKKVRNLARRSTKKARYRNEELACLALFGESRYMKSFHGTETPRAMLAEDLLRAIVR